MQTRLLVQEVIQSKPPAHHLIRLRGRAATMEGSNSDPGGWLHIFLGGVLAAAAKWFWDRLLRTQRPARTEHSNAFLVTQLNQIRDSIDGVAGNVQGLEDRIMRLEQRRPPKPSTSTD